MEFEKREGCRHGKLLCNECGPFCEHDVPINSVCGMCEIVEEKTALIEMPPDTIPLDMMKVLAKLKAGNGLSADGLIMEAQSAILTLRRLVLMIEELVPVVVNILGALDELDSVSSTQNEVNL